MTASGGLSDDCKWVVGPMVDGSNGRGSMGQMVNGVVGHFFCYGLWWWVDMADKGDGGGFFFFFFCCGLWWWGRWWSFFFFFPFLLWFVVVGGCG